MKSKYKTNKVVYTHRESGNVVIMTEKEHNALSRLDKYSRDIILDLIFELAIKIDFHKLNKKE